MGEQRPQHQHDECDAKMAKPIPAMMPVMPGSSRWPGALMAVTVNQVMSAGVV
nr:hypothetical protein [Catenulispora acidiphila]